MAMIYREVLRGFPRLLALAVRRTRTAAESDELFGLYRTLGVVRVREGARANGCEALVGSALRRMLRSDFDSDWSGWLDANAVRTRQLLAAVAALSARLTREGCTTALVESAGVLLQSSLPLDSLGSHDADLLALPADADRIAATMNDAGFEPRARRAHRAPMVEFGRDEADGRTIWINVCYRPFERIWTPLPYRDRNPVWLERATDSTRISGVRLLDPADHLAHVVMHNAFHGFVRKPGFRLHADVDSLIRDNVVNWDRFLGEVRAMRIPTRAFVALAMAAGLLDTPIPASVLSALYPGRLRWTALQRLIQSAGAVTDGRPTFGPLRTAALDVLLDEQGPMAWALRTVVPDEQWMRARFDDPPPTGAALLPLLHARRYARLVSRWHPE